MQGFSAVEMGWGGETFTVPAERAFALALQVEIAIVGERGGSAIGHLLRPGGPTHGQLASGYGAALRFAGAKVSDEEIFLAIQDGLVSHDAAIEDGGRELILRLVAMISPPVATQAKLNTLAKGGADKKK